VHIEVRSFGITIDNMDTVLVKDFSGQFNKYGILKPGAAQAIRMYDVMQFFGTSAQAFLGDTNDTLVGLGSFVSNITDLTAISIGSCGNGPLYYRYNPKQVATMPPHQGVYPSYPSLTYPGDTTNPSNFTQEP
jgi:hypothetical protein